MLCNQKTKTFPRAVEGLLVAKQGSPWLYCFFMEAELKPGLWENTVLSRVLTFNCWREGFKLKPKTIAQTCGTYWNIVHMAWLGFFQQLIQVAHPTRYLSLTRLRGFRRAQEGGVGGIQTFHHLPNVHQGCLLM